MLKYKPKRELKQIEAEILRFVYSIADVDERGRMLDIYLQIRSRKRKAGE